MPHRPKPYEYGCALMLRDEAREYVGELFPSARVEINFAKAAGDLGVGVAANIIGDPSPHSIEAITDCLGQLGVTDVNTIELGAPGRI